MDEIVNSLNGEVWWNETNHAKEDSYLVQLQPVPGGYEAHILGLDDEKYS